jgi:hypothetical protein
MEAKLDPGSLDALLWSGLITSDAPSITDTLTHPTITGLDRVLADRSVPADLGFSAVGFKRRCASHQAGSCGSLEKANNRAHASARAPVERSTLL